MMLHSMFLIVTGGRVMPRTQAAFAGRGADPAGELGEVVRACAAGRARPSSAVVDEVVPLGDEVIDRAARGHAADEFAGVAERDSAVHATRTLLAELLLLHVVVELLPVAHALRGRAVDRQFAQVLDESGWLSHGVLI
jgi:hypothetical protein